MSAEDDSTAILRLTRGSALTTSAVCAPAGLGGAHLEVRAATFCTAHVLKAKDLWKVVIKHGRTDVESELILGSYNVSLLMSLSAKVYIINMWTRLIYLDVLLQDHLERVKKHYKDKIREEVK